MSEGVFEMLMRIGIKNEVSSGLTTIAGQLTAMHGLVTKAESAFGGWKGAIGR
jgi:hypothetical protein